MFATLLILLVSAGIGIVALATSGPSMPGRF